MNTPKSYPRAALRAAKQQLLRAHPTLTVGLGTVPFSGAPALTVTTRTEAEAAAVPRGAGGFPVVVYCQPQPTLL